MMFTVPTNYNGAEKPAENPTIEKGYSGVYMGGVLVAQSRTINLWDEEPEGAEPEEITAEPIHNYSGNGWQGSKYNGSMTTKDIAAAIRKDLKAAYPGVKFSVRTKHASMCHEIIVNAVSGGVRKYYTAATLEELEANGGDPMEKHFVNGYRCNYFYNYALGRDTTEEEKAAYLAEVPTAEFTAMQEGVKAIVKAYNYNDSDGMTDYFDVNFYEDIDFLGYEYIPAKAEGEPKKEETATAEPGKVCGVSVEIIDDTDTRDGSPLTVVKLSERVDREKYNEIAAYMKEQGGYYSRFKGGFIFRNRPEFLEVSEEGGEIQSEEEQPQDIEYIDPSAVAEGDEITLTNIQQGRDRKAVFHCFTPSENSISVTMSNGLNVGVRKVYELGEVFRITAVTHHTPKAEEPQRESEKPQYIATVRAGANETNTAFELVNCEYFETLEESKKYISENKTALENWAGGYIENFSGGVVYEDMEQPKQEEQTAQTGEAEPSAEEKAETIREAAEYYKRVKAESGSYILGAIRTTEKYLDRLTDGEILRAIETAEEEGEDDPTDPNGEPPRPTEERSEPTADPEPIGAEVTPLADEKAEGVKIPKLPESLIQQANSNSMSGNRGDLSAASWAAYCAEIEGWEIADSKKQKIIERAYKKYLPIITAEARHVSVMVAGPAKYNSRKLDHADEVLRSSAEFSTWFDRIRRGISKPKRTGSEERTEQLISSIRDCISNKDNTKNPLDWEGLCRKYLESLAVLNQGEFVEWYERADKSFKFRKSTKISRLYSKAKGGEQIAAEKKEIFSDENLTAYTEGGRVYLRFITPPAQQLKFAMKKRGYWWNAYRSEWSTYENRLDGEWIKSISTRYEKYI